VPLIVDAAAAAGCEYLWPVGLSGGELIGTACYGRRSAPRVTPRPPLQPVPLGAPVIDATASRATERLFRSRLTAGDAVSAHSAAVATADVGASAGEPPLEEDEGAVEAAEKALADSNVAVDKCLLNFAEEAAVVGKGARALDHASRLSLHKSHEFVFVVANHYELPALTGGRGLWEGHGADRGRGAPPRSRETGRHGGGVVPVSRGVGGGGGGGTATTPAGGGRRRRGRGRAGRGVPHPPTRPHRCGARARGRRRWSEWRWRRVNERRDRARGGGRCQGRRRRRHTVGRRG